MTPDTRSLGEIAHTELCLQLKQEPCFANLPEYAKLAWELVANKVIVTHAERLKEAAR